VTVPVWCADLAAGFWAAAGPPPPFPRDLRSAVSAIPFSVIDLDGLTVAGVRGWFERRGLAVPLAEPDRPLRACLVAHRGDGFAFIDRLDPPAERTFSLAHELAHFLRDCLRPREVVERRLGAAVVAVLDGCRSATPDERLVGVLRRVPLRPFTHLLSRDDGGRPASAAERDAEDAADRLAFELLAPAEAVGPATDRDALARRLAGEFGLPPNPAARYASLLLPDPPPLARSLRRLLGK
jgi:hypothetical protein